MSKAKKLFESDSDEGETEYKPSKKQVESSEDEASSSEEDLSTPKKKEKKPIALDKGEKRKREVQEGENRDSNGNRYFEISPKRRVTVRTFPSGEVNVDIREVYQDKASGEMRPGKAGVCLPLNQWEKIKEFIPQIEEAVAELSKKKK